MIFDRRDLQSSIRLTGMLGLLAAAVGLTGCPSAAPGLRHGERLRKVRKAAVLPYVDAPGQHAVGSGKVVVSAVSMELMKCRGLRVIERSQIARIMDEQKFTAAQIRDPDVAAKVGKLSGVDIVFVGDVIQWDAQQEYGHGGVGAITAGGTKHIHRVGVGIRAVDVKTAEVIYARNGQGVNERGFTKAAEVAAAESLRDLRAFYSYYNDPRSKTK